MMLVTADFSPKKTQDIIQGLIMAVGHIHEHAVQIK